MFRKFAIVAHGLLLVVSPGQSGCRCIDSFVSFELFVFVDASSFVVAFFIGLSTLGFLVISRLESSIDSRYQRGTRWTSSCDRPLLVHGEQELDSPSTSGTSVGCDHLVTQLQLVMQIPLASGRLFVSDRVRWRSEGDRPSRTDRIHSQCEISQRSFASRRGANINKVTEWDGADTSDERHGRRTISSETTTTSSGQVASESLVGNLSNSNCLEIKKWGIICVIHTEDVDFCVTKHRSRVKREIHSFSYPLQCIE